MQTTVLRRIKLFPELEAFFHSRWKQRQKKAFCGGMDFSTALLSVLLDLASGFGLTLLSRVELYVFAIRQFQTTRWKRTEGELVCVGFQSGMR